MKGLNSTIFLMISIVVLVASIAYLVRGYTLLDQERHHWGDEIDSNGLWLSNNVGIAKVSKTETVDGGLVSYDSTSTTQPAALTVNTVNGFINILIPHLIDPQKIIQISADGSLAKSTPADFVRFLKAASGQILVTMETSKSIYDPYTYINLATLVPK